MLTNIKYLDIVRTMVDNARVASPALSCSHISLPGQGLMGGQARRRSKMQSTDWISDSTTVGRRMARRALRQVSSLTRLVPDGPEVFGLSSGVDGGWCNVADLNRYLHIQEGIKELLMRFGAISKHNPLLLTAVLAYDYNGESAPDAAWKEFGVDWKTLAASDGGSVVLTETNGEMRLLDLDPNAPLMVSAGWAKDVVYSCTHGIVRTYRRSIDDELIGVQFDGNRVYNWLPR